ncbi:MAG TPA: Mov34/MPN/PAD-1 family protein [Thermoanaerobaculia bacterium]|jgi:hypothetical protein|nr:Mov34/MPN/PAD-1 family protein [Thermoanaerobaculia bacterium]
MLKWAFAAILCAGCASAPPLQTITLPTVAYPFGVATLMRDDVAACSETILSRGWGGRANFERAAFLHLSDDGAFRCDVWPADFQFHRAQWWGATPDGTAALIHSHPRTLPEPSEQDVREAQRLGVPVIVVTPESIAMVMPRDGQIVRVPRVAAVAVAHRY